MNVFDVRKANPEFTYAQSVGYASGREAARLQQQFLRLSEAEWKAATDEYAWGYRKGWKDGQSA